MLEICARSCRGHYYAMEQLSLRAAEEPRLSPLSGGGYLLQHAGGSLAQFQHTRHLMVVNQSPVVSGRVLSYL